MSLNQFEAPPQKRPLTTQWGRLVERASYLDLFVAGAITILLSTLYFWHTPNALKQSGVTFFDALYFSIVTFTSLGYGDLAPSGVGRFIAILNVLFGLAFIALLVGKLASERQQAILLLIHTSDCQRRINDFTFELQQLNSSIKVKLIDCCLVASEDMQANQVLLDHASNRLRAITSYLIFNSYQSRLADFGNESALVALYSEIAKLQEINIAIHKKESQNLFISRITLSIATRCLRLINVMHDLHKRALMKTSYLHQLFHLMESLSGLDKNEKYPSMRRLDFCCNNINLQGNAFTKWTKSHITPTILDRVLPIAPLGPPQTWRKEIGKDIGEKLNINTTLAKKCITELKRVGKLPR